MTTETVQSMGGAVLEECSEENCVVALGSKIGADYIARGTISKFQTKITLTVELYETENGTLVVTSEPVRSESIGELLDKAAAASADMFRKFADKQGAAGKRKSKTETRPDARESALNPKEKPLIRSGAGGGSLFASDFGGGIKWPSGEAVAMPYYGGGVWLFADFVYGEMVIGGSTGGGTWKSAAAPDVGLLPDMQRFYLNGSLLVKCPVAVGNKRIFPIIGIDGELGIFAKLKYTNGKEFSFDDSDNFRVFEYHFIEPMLLRALWVKFGGGIDFDINDRTYLHIELLYGLRPANAFETDMINFTNNGGVAMSGHGLTIRVGVGFIGKTALINKWSEKYGWHYL